VELGRLQLVVDNLSPEDAATFVCRSSNVAGTSEASADIVVNCQSIYTYTAAIFTALIRADTSIRVLFEKKTTRVTFYYSSTRYFPFPVANFHFRLQQKYRKYFHTRCQRRRTCGGSACVDPKYSLLTISGFKFPFLDAVFVAVSR